MDITYRGNNVKLLNTNSVKKSLFIYSTLLFQKFNLFIQHFEEKNIYL